MTQSVGRRGHGLDDRNSITDRSNHRKFSLDHRIQTVFGVPQISYPMVIGESSLVVKRPEHEADHSPPYSAEINNTWSYTPTPTTSLYGVVLS
jgi:hypothetical protein